MSKHWTFRPFDPAQVRSLMNVVKIPAVLAQILCAREFTDPEQVRRFLDPQISTLPQPQTLPGCTEVAQRIYHAIRNERKITVYGDYDVDGMTGTAILMKVIRLLGKNPDCVNYYIPSRLDDGYGLNDEALNKLFKDGTQVVVSVDCGISACEEAKTAKTLGIELLITDHHTPGPELPNVEAIAHPQLVRWHGKLCSPNAPEVLEFLQTENETETLEKYPFVDISGAVVAFKVAAALGQLFFEGANPTPLYKKYQEFLLEAMGLATMGTIADVVPMLDENRTLVRCCLEKSFTEHLCLGLHELLNIAKINKDKALNTETIGFQLAPRLNAAGRMGQAMLGVELLLTTDPKRAKELAENINKLNKKRQEREREIQEEAESQIRRLYSLNDAAFVLDSNDSRTDDMNWQHWHPGVIGIVAGRLSEKYCRPVVVISRSEKDETQTTGSARGIPHFNLYDALEACKEHLERFGGHASAAGLGINSENIPAFRDAFVEFCQKKITEAERVASQTLWIDAEYPFSAFTFKTVQQVEKLAPFGCENRRPTLCSSNVYLEETPAKRMGADGQHFSATFLQDGIALRGVAFGHGDWVDEMDKFGCGPFDIAFHVVLNTFAGRTKVELQILDWRPADN